MSRQTYGATIYDRKFWVSWWITSRILNSVMHLRKSECNSRQHQQKYRGQDEEESLILIGIGQTNLQYFIQYPAWHLYEGHWQIGACPKDSNQDKNRPRVKKNNLMRNSWRHWMFSLNHGVMGRYDSYFQVFEGLPNRRQEKVSLNEKEADFIWALEIIF